MREMFRCDPSGLAGAETGSRGAVLDPVHLPFEAGRSVQFRIAMSARLNGVTSIHLTFRRSELELPFLNN